MSAFIVSKKHIDALVGAAIAYKGRGIQAFRWIAPNPFQSGNSSYDVDCALDLVNADQVGRMLWKENIRSVCHRYPEKDRAELSEAFSGYREAAEYADAETYRFRRLLDTLPALPALLKAIDCYEYQSCEHPEWEVSSARAFCQALRKTLIQQLPGYDAAPWGID
jgi:hypothetical protein